MRIQLFVTLTIAIYLLLPGYMFLLAARIQRNRFLLSYGVSISCLVILLTLTLMVEETNSLWFVLVYSIIVLPVTGVIWYFRKRTTNTLAKTTLHKILNKNTAICYLLVILSYCAYHLAVGPYTEIPSDFWKHLARVGIEHQLLVGEEFRQGNFLAYLSSGSSVIYIALAMVAHSFAVDPIDLVPATTLVTSSIFLTSIYWFSISLFCRYFGDSRWVFIGASLATILTLISFGTATFSYVRYYAYFPTIFGFPLVYASIVLFTAYLERPQRNSAQLILIPLFLVAMTLIHPQEALLTIVILGGIALVRSVRTLFPSSNFDHVLIIRARASLYFFISLLVVVVVYAFTQRELTEWQHTPHVLDGGQIASFLSGLPMDNPSFRLWDTLGIFGLIVYGWAMLHWKIIRRSDYLIAGLMVPIFTSLNPIYATVFLHYGSPTSLWRTAYLIPLPIVAALLICYSLSCTFWAKSILKGSLSVIVLGLLFISLAPWSFQGYYNRTSRIPSLMPVHAFSGAGLWMDLTEELRKIETTGKIRRILTDEMTKFVLYAANRREISWWPEHEYFPKNRDVYKQDFSESDFTDSILVVNRRNGVNTNSARHAGHWPNQILQISRHYPKDLDIYLLKNEDHFQLLWESDKIAVYQMSTFNE